MLLLSSSPIAALPGTKEDTGCFSVIKEDIGVVEHERAWPADLICFFFVKLIWAFLGEPGPGK